MGAIVRGCSCGRWFAGLAVVVLCGAPPAQAGDDTAQYRRWRTSNTYSCERTAPDVIAVSLPEQAIEFNNLPVGAEFSSASIRNGVARVSSRFPVEQSDGEIVYGNFAEYFDAYPLTYDFRLDTIIDGAVVYRSTYAMACDGNTADPVPMEAEHIDFGPPADRWLRWTWPKTYTCNTTPDGVEIAVGNYDVESSGLPAHATFYLDSFRNGYQQRGGPFTLDEIVALLEGFSVVELTAPYPVHHEHRIDTVINGIVAYTSTLVTSCNSADEGLGLTADITSHGNFDLFVNGFEAASVND